MHSHGSGSTRTTFLVSGTDINRYVGIPFKRRGRGIEACDCFGLVHLLYRDLLGIDLPAYAGCDADRIDQERHKWQLVELGSERFGDVACFWNGRPGNSEHVGFVIKPGQMLHCVEGCDSSIAYYDTSTRGALWRPRLVAIHRHRNLAPN